MAHCNNQMTDFSPVTPPGINSGIAISARDTARLGLTGALGCVTNGANLACAYRESPDALVYYDASGNVLWTSGKLLDGNTYKNTPIIQADGSVVVGDNLNTIKFNRDGSVAWSTPTVGGSPISQVTTPNGAIFTATHPVAVNTCPQNTCNLLTTLNNPGSGYTTAAVTLTGGDCPGTSATATVSGAQVTAVNITAQGSNCIIAPDIIITGDGAGAQANAQLVAPAPVTVYNGATGALVGSMYLYASGVSGPYYETINVPCVNNGSYPNRVYVSTNLSTNQNQGALWALDIDPANLANPISPAWSVTFGGPSGASPLCIGNKVYFDGAGQVPGDNAGTTIFGVHDNGSSASILFHVSLGADAAPITCNFALDPRPAGGFWHEIQYDPNLYHRDGANGNIIETLDVSSLLAAGGAVPGTYWMSGVFNTVGTPDHPYMILPESAISYAASYLTMIDLTDLSLVWALPLYPGNSPYFSDSFEGEAAILMNSGGQPVVAMATRYNGAFFLADGQGTAAISSSALRFGDQSVGGTSASQAVTLTNTSSTVLNVASINVTGDFAEAGTCAAPMPPGAGCLITVSFTPSATGPRTGSMVITSNAAGSPQTISLSGVGITGVPDIALSAHALSFAAQTIGTTSPPQVVTLKNRGAALLTLTGFVGGGDALQTNNCPSSLAPAADCSVNVMFTPGGAGSRTGTVTINSNASNSPQVISLAGTGSLAGGPAAGLTSSSLVFPVQNLGVPGKPQSVFLYNPGTAALGITSIAATGAASQTNNCPATLAPKSHCAITVTYTPVTIGPGAGAVTLIDNAPDSPQHIFVSGVAWGNPLPLLAQASPPAGLLLGGPGFTLNVLGGGFIPGATVNWNGAAVPTAYIGPTQLSATVAPSRTAAAKTATISVVNSGPGGGASNPVWLPITTPSEWLSMGRSDLRASAGPRAVLTADLNGDGRLDLLAVNSVANTISVLLGNGDGTFAAAVDYPAGSQPVAAALGDFSGDGNLDIVVANQGDNTVSVFLGNGQGAFAPGLPYPTGNSPVAVAAADINGDGTLDLVVANQADNTVSLLAGNADGTFNAHVDYPAGPSPTALLAGDFNADGKLDMAVANDFVNGTVSVLLGNGDGTFKPPVAYATGDSVAVAAADFNGDGKLDLAAVNQLAQTLSVLLGKGDGTFQPALTKLLELSPAGLAIGDLNADGTLDVAVANSADGTVSILYGYNNGLFRDPLDFPVASGPLAVTLGDFNGDGSLDLATAAMASNTLSVLVQSPALTFSASGINVGNVTLGRSASQSLTLTNTGSAVLTIASISTSGPFSQTNNCPHSLAAGNACTITVTGTPTAKGPFTGLLTINDNAPGSPQAIGLNGTGVAGKLTLSLSASPIDSGNPLSSNTVSLSYPAPRGGALVTLSSSNPLVASVPASATIAAGSQVSLAFTITTTGVDAPTAVTLSATFNGVTSTAVLTVNPAVLQSLTLSPATVVGGQSTTGNFATFDGQSPPAGAILALSSANPAVASVPASVQISAYSNQSPAFAITTAAVTTATHVVITATYGKSHSTATLTINP